jgi:Tfp pilus assembly protein PilF
LYAANLKPTVALLRCLKQHVDDGTATTATYFNLSNEYAKRDKYNEAITYLEKAIELAPNSFEAQNNLALLLARHKPEKIQRAVELIEKAYATAPNRPEVNDSYGEILLIAKRPMDAIAKLTTSLNTNKSRVGTRKLLIRAFEEAGLPEMAQTHRDILKQLEGTE